MVKRRNLLHNLSKIKQTPTENKMGDLIKIKEAKTPISIKSNNLKSGYSS